MLAEERQMIESLGERLHKAGEKIQKDKEAAALIEEKVAGQKDVVYQLTQATLLQEHALGQAQQQIAQLRAELEQQHQQAAQTQKPSGSFLGNLFGGNKNQQTQTPPPRPSGFAGETGQQQFTGAPGYNNGAYHNNASPQQGGFMGGAAQPSAGGSFLRNAAAGAVGVAGGMFLFEGLSHMFGGGAAHAAAPTEVVNNETVINEATPAESFDAGQMGLDSNQQGAMDTGAFDQGTFDNTSMGDFSDFGSGDDFGSGGFDGGDW